MDAVKFLQERVRMCNSFSSDCEGCRDACSKPVMSECCRWMFENPERAVKIVEGWSAEHPQKTRQNVFLEQYPDAEIDGQGVPYVCPAEVYGEQACPRIKDGTPIMCYDCRSKFWMQEVT